MTVKKEEAVKEKKVKKEIKSNISATGRRKTSIARVWIKNGTGQLKINNEELNKRWGREELRYQILEPLLLTNTLNKFDVSVNVKGGGVSGQAGAISHGIARALILADASLRRVLKTNGLLTRDPRMKERKKYGRKRARKGYQYRKR